MHLATIRVQDTEVLSLACPRLDERRGAAVVDLVLASVKNGARQVVVELGPETVIDFAGARALRAAAAEVGTGRFFVAGLSGRARAMLRAVRVSEQVRMVEWWTDATPPLANAA